MEVLSAGYNKHFVEEVEAMQEKLRYGYPAYAISLVYALLPSIVLVAFPTSIVGQMDNDLVEGRWLNPLSGVCNFITLLALLGSLNCACADIQNSLESFIILHRMASSHHQRKTEFWEYERKARRGTSRLFNRHSVHNSLSSRSDGGDDSRRPSLGSERSEGSAFQPPQIGEYRQRVRFKASLMRGADCHINMGHMNRFDSIMAKYYGVTQKKAKGQSHCNSFVELNLHNVDQLRMWWHVRCSIEAGLLRHKVFTELLLYFILVVLAMLVVFTFSWLALMKPAHGALYNYMHTYVHDLGYTYMHIHGYSSVYKHLCTC